MPDTHQTKNAKQPGPPVEHGPDTEQGPPHDLLQVWEKLSEKILESMNKRFDLLDNKFDSLMSTQRALTERLIAVEEQGSDHERRIEALELNLADMKKQTKGF